MRVIGRWVVWGVLALWGSAVWADQMVISFKDGRKQVIDLDSIANVQYTERGEKTPKEWVSKGDFSPAAYYRIISHQSGKCLDVSGPSLEDGANIYQWDCHGGANQAWRIVPGTPGYYTLIARHSKKCADVAGVETRNGANVHQWECHGGANQEWKITRRPDGLYTLAARHSRRCLHIAGAGHQRAANAVQWACGKQQSQGWIIRP